MLQQRLTELRDFILEHNKYFSQGYDEVYVDEVTGIVHNSMPVFPADNLGNYFYLRLPNNVAFDYDKVYNVSDAVNGVGIKSQVYLIACVRDAYADELLGNLVNTLRAYQGDNIKLLNAIYQPEVVIVQELSKASKTIAAAAMQHRDAGYSIVSLSFFLTVPFQFNQLNCIKNPCKTC